MVWLLKVFDSLKTFFAPQGGGCRIAVSPTTATATPVDKTEMTKPTVSVNVNDEQLFDKALHDIQQRKRRIFRIFCRPLDGIGSDVVCEVTKKYALGTQINRIDGRIFEIYRIKKSKRSRIEPPGPTTWRVAS